MYMQFANKSYINSVWNTLLRLHSIPQNYRYRLKSVKNIVRYSGSQANRNNRNIFHKTACKDYCRSRYSPHKSASATLNLRQLRRLSQGQCALAVSSNLRDKFWGTLQTDEPRTESKHALKGNGIVGADGWPGHSVSLSATWYTITDSCRSIDYALWMGHWIKVVH